MEQLLIMRHAKSDWDAPAGDIDRQLLRRGRRDALRMGAWLQQRELLPGRILCSPARRTRETLELLLQVMSPGRVDIQYESGIYEASLDDLLAILQQHADAVETLMLIGHNPGVDALVGYLSHQPVPRTASGKLMTTAAVAVMQPRSCSSLLAEAGAELAMLVRPKDLG